MALIVSVIFGKFPELFAPKINWADSSESEKSPEELAGDHRVPRDVRDLTRVLPPFEVGVAGFHVPAQDGAVVTARRQHATAL